MFDGMDSRISRLIDEIEKLQATLEDLKAQRKIETSRQMPSGIKDVWTERQKETSRQAILRINKAIQETEQKIKELQAQR
jgi:predicted RNase H-like nuclease (RuvC/YqgF family)